MKNKMLLAIAVFWVLPLNVCSAEWFEGEVGKVDLQAKTVTVSEVDPITDTEESNEIVVDDATVFSGVKSLKELKSGDDVTVEAKYDEPTDSWKAVSVEMAEAGE